MLNKKYIIKAGNYYGCDFYRYANIEYCVTEDINNARIANTLSTAKSNATRLRKNLLYWAKKNVHNDPRPYEPIEILEVDLTVGAIAYSQPSILYIMNYL